MTDKHPGSPPAGLRLGDFLFVVFRHKWKIISISLCAILAAVLCPVLMPTPYMSEARLYIRYVVESSTPTSSGDSDSRIRSPDNRGTSIINTELQILTSLDLAQQVVDGVGADKILAKVGGGTNRLHAAAIVQNNIRALVPRESSVINLSFQHPDPQVVQPVLVRLIDSYFKKHAEIHRVGAFDDFLEKETDQLRSRVAQTSEELRKARARFGITSVQEAKKTLENQLSSLQQQKLSSQTELAERRAVLNEILKKQGLHAESLSNAASPQVASASTNTVPQTNVNLTVPAAKTAEYKKICSLLETLEKREQELLMTYTEEYALVRVVRSQIENNRNLKTQLETEFPSLAAVKVISTPAGPGRPEPQDDLTSQWAHVRGLESRLQELTSQLEELRKRAAEFYEAEGTITELERRLQLEEANYIRFSQNLEQSKIDERLGAGKISNISTIQEPTPAAPIASKMLKIVALTLVGGIGFAFGLAFLIEFYVDQTLRRPSEALPKLGMPVFISIPMQDLTDKPGTSGNTPSRPLLRDSNGEAAESSLLPAVAADCDMPPWDTRHKMQPFFETLRDRLITHFEARNLTHKPKLVSVTSCGVGAGVSTIAAGLAASLSETGEGNVLLVDMNVANGSARRFYRGDLECGIGDVLGKETRSQAMVQDKLYLVSETQAMEGLPSALPTRFKSLVPRLKASDFDYIIFDMPPVTETSITPRLSKFMDTVLMVVEAEKTSVDVIRRANSILAESRANVSVILNKQQDYLPKLLQHYQL
jgi:uncharacterized protein involved in exopolysaccharide biosynthesis/Mrp family chromosome partitioning ATPase